MEIKVKMMEEKEGILIPEELMTRIRFKILKQKKAGMPGFFILQTMHSQNQPGQTPVDLQFSRPFQYISPAR